MKYILVSLLIIIKSFTCLGGDNKISSALKKWKSLHPNSYEYEIKWDYFYTPHLRGPFFVRVINGKVDSVWYNFEESIFEKGSIVEKSSYSLFSIDTIFENVQEKLKMKFKSFEYDFDDSLGYPYKYKIVYDNDLGESHPECFFLKGLRIINK